MEKLKNTLFEETQRIVDAYRSDIDHESRSVAVWEFQALYNVICKAGFEQEYLGWRREHENVCD